MLNMTITIQSICIVLPAKMTAASDGYLSTWTTYFFQNCFVWLYSSKSNGMRLCNGWCSNRTLRAESEKKEDPHRRAGGEKDRHSSLFQLACLLARQTMEDRRPLNSHFPLKLSKRGILSSCLRSVIECELLRASSSASHRAAAAKMTMASHIAWATLARLTPTDLRP